MKLSSLKRIVQEDLRNEKDTDGKFDKVLTAVNQFMDEVEKPHPFGAMLANP